MTKSKKLLAAISEAYSDEPVRQNTELESMLMTAAKKLDADEEPSLIAVKLSNSISRYSLQHKLELPASISTLYGIVEKEAAGYRGAVSATMWL